MAQISIYLTFITFIILCESTVRTKRFYYINGINVLNFTEDGETFCAEVLPLLRTNTFVTYKIGERSHTNDEVLFEDLEYCYLTRPPMNVTITTVLHFEGRDEPNALESTAVDITFAQSPSLSQQIYFNKGAVGGPFVHYNLVSDDVEFAYKRIRTWARPIQRIN